MCFALCLRLRKSALLVWGILLTTMHFLLFCFALFLMQKMRKPVFKALLTMWNLILNFSHACLAPCPLCFFWFSVYNMFHHLLWWNSININNCLGCSTSSSSKTNLLVKPLINVIILGPLVQKIPSTTTDHGWRSTSHTLLLNWLATYGTNKQ